MLQPESEHGWNATCDKKGVAQPNIPKSPQKARAGRRMEQLVEQALRE
jgi:hypothetical protein